MGIDRLNLKNKKQIKINKGNKKKERKYKERTLNDTARTKRQGYSKNMVAQQTIHFRPTSQIKAFLNLQKDKSKTIREALELLMKKRTKTNLFLSELSMDYPFLWRSVNRRNAQFITQKIKELK